MSYSFHAYVQDLGNYVKDFLLVLSGLQQSPEVVCLSVVSKGQQLSACAGNIFANPEWFLSWFGLKLKNKKFKNVFSLLGLAYGLVYSTVGQPCTMQCWEYVGIRWVILLISRLSSIEEELISELTWCGIWRVSFLQVLFESFHLQFRNSQLWLD